jgi:hypothetical protein
MWRDRLKFELIGCGLMLLAFVIALGIGIFVVFANGFCGTRHRRHGRQLHRYLLDRRPTWGLKLRRCNVANVDSSSTLGFFAELRIAELRPLGPPRWQSP